MSSTLARPARNLSLVLAATAATLLATGADAGIVNLGGNWQAEWDPSLDGLVDIQVDAIANNNIFIQKSAQFTQGPVGGLFPTIAIVFRQIGPSTINHIVINDEIITNLTGVAWTDFHMEVLDNGNAAFNPALTAVSGGPGPIGFSIAPFTTASFANANTQLNIAGGTVANGASWFPGGGAFDGQLWIDVVSGAGTPTNPFTTFTLKETPTPTPGVLALLGLAGLAGRSRRRR